MQLKSISIYQLRIPFRQSFEHARQSRDESDAVVVRVRDAEGNVGYGEGLPRPYVTGEDVHSMVAYLETRLAPKVFATSFNPGWRTFEFLDSVASDWTRKDIEGKQVTAWNAAFCAIELALIDWSLRRTDASLGKFLSPARDEVVYSGVVSADSPEVAAALANRYVANGIRQLKIKVGTSGDVARLAAVRTAVGDGVELRADANGAWSVEDAIRCLGSLQPFRLACIEQPVAAEDFAGLKQVREATGLRVMADESLVTRAQAEELIELEACDLFNIRVSKNGGISGSLAIAKLARQAGIAVQVGAQVGETAILSAAGRHLAAHVPSLAYAEGSFGKLLLTEDIGMEDLTFGQGGVAPALRGKGLGVTVREELLKRFSVRKIELQP